MYASPTVSRSVRPIESILLHRERSGFAVIDELRAIVTRATTVPNPCCVVLGGPDALSVPDVPAAITWLLELGFVPQQDDEGTPMLVLPRVYDPNSADWKLFQRRGAVALKLLDWAAYGNSSLLKIRIVGLTVAKAFSSAFCFQLLVEWQDELGNPKTQLFPMTQWNEKSETTLAELHLAGAPTSGVSYSSAFETFETACDTKCIVTVNIMCKRIILNKLQAKTVYMYDNSGVVHVDAPLKDDDRSLCGVLSLEVDSLAHRAAAAEARMREAAAQSANNANRETTGDSAAQTDPNLKGELKGEDTLPTAKKWVDKVTPAPNDEGVRYDSDTYF